MLFINFVIHNIGTIAVALVLAAIVSAIVIVSLKAKREGRSSCGGGCAGCPMSGKCHSANADDKLREEL